MVVLFGDVVFFALLTWYFDNVIASNRGRGESVFFPFIRIYKFIFKSRSRRKVLPEDDVDQLRNPNFLLQDEE